MIFENLITMTLLISCYSCVPIRDKTINSLIDKVFLIPRSGGQYLNVSVALVTKSNVCLNGVCVPFHLCVNGNVLTTGENLFVRRIGAEDDNDEPRYCNETEKCCKLSDDDDSDEDEAYMKFEKLPMKMELTRVPKSYEKNEMLEYSDWRPKCGIENNSMAAKNNISFNIVCVPINLCVNGSVVTTGANIFVPRIGEEDTDDEPRYCTETEECCKLSYDEDDDDLDNRNSYKDESQLEKLPIEIELNEADKEYEDKNTLEYTDNLRPKCGVQNISMLALSTNENISSIEVCVLLHLCVNGCVETTGANRFAPRIRAENNNEEPRYCEETEECCKLCYVEGDDNLKESDVEQLPMTKELDEVDEYYSNRDIKILEYTESWRPKCGVRNVNIFQPRISGEDFAGVMEFPWMVVIMKKLPKYQYYDYQCGGSLIHPSAVLTAAHCVALINPKLLYVRVGEWDMRNTNEILPHQDRELQSIVIHRDFVKLTLMNDIAILILKAPVELAENVNTICLPPPNYSFDNENCLVSGWGKDNHDGRYQRVLKKVNVPILPHRSCEMMFRNTVLGKYFRLDKTFMCAGGEYGKDSCLGDGGSPLVCRISDTSYSYYQSGIVSWGVGCKELNVPGAYVNVARYRDWIDKVMHRMNLEIDSYVYE